MPGNTQLSRQKALEILALEPDASEAEITKAYRKLALQMHPDRPGGSTEAFQKLNNAKTALTLDAKQPITQSHPEPEPATSTTSASHSASYSTGFTFQVPTEAQKKQWAQEDFKDNLTKIHQILDNNLADISHNAGIKLYHDNIDKITSFAYRRTPIFHNLSGEKKRERLSPNERILILEQILNTVHSSHQPHRSQNLSYITQDLLDFLLAPKTNLAEVQNIFESLASSNELNISTIDFVITKPAYAAILASTLKHVTEAIFKECNNDDYDKTEEILKRHASAILEFYEFFPVTCMESIDFEAELLETLTIAGIYTVINKYQDVLQHAKDQKETVEATELLQKTDLGGEEETKEREEPRQKQEQETYLLPIFTTATPIPETAIPDPINRQHEAIQSAVQKLHAIIQTGQNSVHTDYAEELEGLNELCGNLLITHNNTPLNSTNDLVRHYTAALKSTQGNVEDIKSKPKSWSACETIGEQATYIMHAIESVIRSFFNVISCGYVNADNHDHYFFHTPHHEKPEVENLTGALDELNICITTFKNLLSPDNTLNPS